MTRRFHTVGFSDRPMEYFIGLLKKHKIKTVVDVRTNPGSGHAKQFNRETLESVLPTNGFSYRHRGKVLGGHPEDSALYRPDGRVNFDLLERQPEFEGAVDALLEEEMAAPALACTEKNLFECPRFFLLGPILVARGIEVVHIDYQTGEAETHADAERRMVEYVAGGGAMSLFSSADDVAAGYRRLKFEYSHRLPGKRKGR